MKVFRLLVLLMAALSVTGCGAAAPDVEHPEHPESSEHGECDGDLLPHPTFTPERYAAMLDNERRPEWQQPARVVEALGLPTGSRVADLGTGSGFWLAHLDAAVGEGGRVLGEDIDADLLAIAQERVDEGGLSRVELRLGAHDDPRLEAGAYDLILMVNTYHHICDRVGFVEHVARALAPGGRFVIIDFKHGEPIPVAGSRHRIERDAIAEELRGVGFEVIREHDFLEYQYFLELELTAD